MFSCVEDFPRDLREGLSAVKMHIFNGNIVVFDKGDFFLSIHLSGCYRNRESTVGVQTLAFFYGFISSSSIFLHHRIRLFAFSPGQLVRSALPELRQRHHRQPRRRTNRKNIETLRFAVCLGYDNTKFPSHIIIIQASCGAAFVGVARETLVAVVLLFNAAQVIRTVNISFFNSILSDNITRVVAHLSTLR